MEEKNCLSSKKNMVKDTENPENIMNGKQAKISNNGINLNSSRFSKVFESKLSIIPTIDISRGRAVLVCEGKVTMDNGDPLERADLLSINSDFQIVDLDRAGEIGDNSKLIKQICLKYPCYVAGGIRNYEIASDFLNNNAKRIVVSTALNKDFISKIPKDRLIIAFDIDEEFNLYKRGRKELTKENLFDKIKELHEHISFITITFHYFEGKGKGTDIEKIKIIKQFIEENSFKIRVAVAGGINSLQEISEIINMGITPQFGLGLWKKNFTLGEIYANIMNYSKMENLYHFKEQGKPTLFPVVILNSIGQLLGLTYTDFNGIKESIDNNKCVFYSRERQCRWLKGETSGNFQKLLKVGLNCDRTALIFKVQDGYNFCHLEQVSCFNFNDYTSKGILFLEKNIKEAIEDKSFENTYEQTPENHFTQENYDCGCFTKKIDNCNLNQKSLECKTELQVQKEKVSYTKLISKNKKAQIAKILEEANEICFANCENKENLIHEISDLIYFLVLYCLSNNVNISEILNELNKRNYKITKPSFVMNQPPSDLKIGICLKKACDDEIFRFAQKIGLKIVKPNENARSLYYEAKFLRNTDVKVIPIITKPKDVYKLMQNNLIDAVICYRDCMDNYPVNYVKINHTDVINNLKDNHMGLNKEICDSIKPKICIIGRIDFDISKYENNPNMKLIVFSEYPHLTNLWLEKKKIIAKMIAISGSSEGYVLNKICDLAVCIVVSGNTVQENKLQIIDTIYISEIGLFANKGKEGLFTDLII